jgi:peptidoglycan-associated lipoprotein
MTRFSRLLLLSVLCLVIAAGFSACRRPVPAPAPAPPPAAAPEPPPPPPPPPPPAPAPERPLTEEEIFAKKTVDDLNRERPLGDVFFDFDQSTLRDDARGTLQKNAEWLRRWTTTRITVEGHCDNRGTPEYNLALGERRASAVRDYLVSLGVSGERIQAVSKGEEEPFCREDTEECWQQNRRGHFVFTAK